MSHTPCRHAERGRAALWFMPRGMPRGGRRMRDAGGGRRADTARANRALAACTIAWVDDGSAHVLVLVLPSGRVCGGSVADARRLDGRGARRRLGRAAPRRAARRRRRARDDDQDETCERLALDRGLDRGRLRGRLALLARLLLRLGSALLVGGSRRLPHRRRRHAPSPPTRPPPGEARASAAEGHDDQTAHGSGREEREEGRSRTRRGGVVSWWA